MSRRGSILQDYGNINHTQTMEAQHNAAQYYQRDKEQANQMQQQKERDKQKQQGDATDFIGGLNVPHVGDNTIDLYNDAQIQKLQGELNGMQAKGASLQDIKLKAMQELPKIAQGYTVAKNGYSQITEGLKDLTKDYPSGDMQTARSLAGKELIKDIFDYDENGNIKGYKDPSLIPQGKNYLQNLESPENLSQWYSPSGALVKHIQTLPHTNLGESSKVRDKKGVERDNIWTGTGTVFSEVKRDENGKAIGMDIKSETIPLGKNEDGTDITIDVLPKDEFNVMLGNKQAAADFTLDFQKRLRDMEIDPAKIDPRAMDYLQRQYARDWLKQTGIEGSSFIPKVAEKQPLPPRISVKVDNGYKTGSAIPSIEVYKGIESKVDAHSDVSKLSNPMISRVTGNPLAGTPANILDQNEISEVMSALSKGGYKEKTPEDIYLSKDRDGIWIMDAATDKALMKMSKVGTDVHANTPLGVGAKREAANKAGVNSGNKTFNVIDPNTGKIIIKNVDESSANKAKAKGYKIQ